MTNFKYACGAGSCGSGNMTSGCGCGSGGGCGSICGSGNTCGCGSGNSCGSGNTCGSGSTCGSCHQKPSGCGDHLVPHPLDFCGDGKPMPLGGKGPAGPVCIETNRILDSCRDRDCYNNVKVFLCDMGQEIIEHTTQIRVKEARIAWTYIGIDPVQFNHGFYTIHIRFYIKLIFEACVCAGHSQEFEGIAVLEKQAVLYGGDSHVNIFRSSAESGSFCSSELHPGYRERSVPTAVVEAVDPLILGCCVMEPRKQEHICCCCCACDIPENVCRCLSSPICPDQGEKENRTLVVSLGIFSLVRIVRPGQYVVNASEFAVPDKECISATSDNPCELFRSMAFPVSEFSPTPMPSPLSDRNHGGCIG